MRNISISFYYHPWSPHSVWCVINLHHFDVILERNETTLGIRIFLHFFIYFVNQCPSCVGKLKAKKKRKKEIKEIKKNCPKLLYLRKKNTYSSIIIILLETIEFWLSSSSFSFFPSFFSFFCFLNRILENCTRE